MKAEIHDRGRGPEIKGTRITVYDIYDYRGEYSAKWIAELFKITVEQVEAACAYIDAHSKEVAADIAEMDARAAKERNSPKILALMAEGHKKLLAMKERLRREGKLPPPSPPAQKIEGTEVSVDDIAVHRGFHSTEWIAELYKVTVDQVKTAYAYLDAHKSENRDAGSEMGSKSASGNSLKIRAVKAKPHKKPPAKKKQLELERREKAHA